MCPRGAFVGADAYISPADCTGFSEIFGEFVTSGKADVYRFKEVRREIEIPPGSFSFGEAKENAGQQL